MKPHARFLLSATAAQHFPAGGAPEIAFLGRSNVGKSSLLNSLVGEPVARVSSTPGRTQSINFFEVRLAPAAKAPQLMFVDLPGYGYAKAPRALVAGWRKFIEPYLMERSSLALCVCLVDASVPPQEKDRDLQRFLRAAGRPTLLVATKTDRLSGNQQRNSLEALRRSFGVAELLPFSAKTGRGRDQLWRILRALAV